MRQWGRGIRAAVTQRARLKCVALDKPSDARLRNQARVTEQDVRKRFIYRYTICPYSSRIITGSASKAEKVPNFTKPTFPKKGVGKLKKYISGITKASAFEWYASFVLSPPTPSNEQCYIAKAVEHICYKDATHII